MLGAETEPGPVPAPGHRELGQERRFDDSGVGGHHHQLSGMPVRHHVESSVDTTDEAGPALTARSDDPVGIAVPVDRTEPCGELVPGQSVGFAGMELAQVALGDQTGRFRSGRRRSGTEPSGQRRCQPFGRLDGPGQDAGIEGVGAGQLTAFGQPAGQSVDLFPAPRREPPATHDPTADTRHVALRLAMADQHDPGGPG